MEIEVDRGRAPGRAPAPARGLWTSRDFIALWVGQTVSEMGSRITREGIPLTALLALHAGALQMGLLAALGGAATLAFGLAAGSWVDRHRRRPILIGADLGRAVLLASIPVAAAAGALRMGQLYAVVALAGALTVFFDVAYQSYLPSLVPREQLVEGNSKLALSSSLAEILGPGATGVLVQLITAPIAILFDAVSFAISALSVAAIRKPEPAPARCGAAEDLWAEMAAGLRFIFAEPLLRALGLRSTTAFLCHGFMGSLYMLYAIDVLRIRPALLGVVIALGGVGAMAGALAAQPVARRLGRGPTFLVTSTVYGLTSLLIPLAGAVPGHAALLLMVPQLLGDAMFAIYSIHEVSLRQEVAPAAVLGRVNAGIRLLQLGIYPLGAVLGGLFAARAGVRPALALAAAGLLLSTLWLAASPLRRLR